MEDGKKGIRLLQEKHFEMKNTWGDPVVGWKETSDGIGGLYNPMGFSLLRVVVHDTNKEGEFVPLYDQPLIVEKPGVMIVIEYQNKLALIENYRMIGPRVKEVSINNYVGGLNDGVLWGKLIDSLGQVSLEIPRGVINSPDTHDLEVLILKTAKEESLEEAGMQLEDVKIAGTLNPNTTFFAHNQYVVHAKLKDIGENKPEEKEFIGDAKLYSCSEIRELVNNNVLIDALSLAAFAVCGINF